MKFFGRKNDAGDAVDQFDPTLEASARAESGDGPELPVMHEIVASPVLSDAPVTDVDVGLPYAVIETVVPIPAEPERKAEAEQDAFRAAVTELREAEHAAFAAAIAEVEQARAEYARSNRERAKLHRIGEQQDRRAVA